MFYASYERRVGCCLNTAKSSREAEAFHECRNVNHKLLPTLDKHVQFSSQTSANMHYTRKHSSDNVQNRPTAQKIPVNIGLVTKYLQNI